MFTQTLRRILCAVPGRAFPIPFSGGITPSLTLAGMAALILVLQGCAANRLHNVDLYMQQEDWSRARKALEEAISANPMDERVHLLLAEVYGELNLFQNMRQVLKNLVAMSPEYAEEAAFLRKKFWLKNFKLGFQHLQEKAFEYAIYRFEMAVLLDSTDVRGYQRLADAHFLSGRLHEAQKAYQAALEHKPDDLVIMNNLAEVHYLQRNYAQAVDLCEEILAADPAHPHARLRRAYALKDAGEFSAAEAAFRQLLAEPPNADVMTDLGLLYFEQGKIDRAIRQFTDALRVADDKTVLYRYLGEAHRLNANYLDMARWYSRLVEANPQDLNGWKNLAIAYQALGAREKLAEARTQIDKLRGSN